LLRGSSLSCVINITPLNDCEVDIAEMAIAEKLRHNAIVGSSEQVAARLKEFAKGLELDELVVVTWTYDPAPRPDHRLA